MFCSNLIQIERDSSEIGPSIIWLKKRRNFDYFQNICLEFSSRNSIWHSPWAEIYDAIHQFIILLMSQVMTYEYFIDSWASDSWTLCLTGFYCSLIWLTFCLYKVKFWTDVIACGADFPPLGECLVWNREFYLYLQNLVHNFLWI